MQEARLFAERLRETSHAPTVYVELAGAQHAFEMFHSIRALHTVSAVDAFSAWVLSPRRKGVGHRDRGHSTSEPDQRPDNHDVEHLSGQRRISGAQCLVSTSLFVPWGARLCPHGVGEIGNRLDDAVGLDSRVSVLRARTRSSKPRRTSTRGCPRDSRARPVVDDVPVEYRSASSPHG